jgi:hypothetical protein
MSRSELPDRPVVHEQNSALREWGGALWAAFIFVMYMVHQMRLLWPSIREELLLPLLNRLP